MFPSVPLLSSFVQMITQHNKAFHKVTIWQEKDQCKYHTDKYREEKHLDVHGLFPVERVWEFGDFNSWTGLILETTSHLSKIKKNLKKSTHLWHFTHQMRELGGQFPRPPWEQKEIGLDREQTVFLLFPLLTARTSPLLHHGSGVLDLLLSCLHSISSWVSRNLSLEFWLWPWLAS